MTGKSVLALAYLLTMEISQGEDCRRWNARSGRTPSRSRNLPGIDSPTSAWRFASDQKGATAELSFEGKKALLFAKLGADCGKAAVSIDGGAPEIVDTHSADDIWGVCIYRKTLAAGRHTLRVEALGERSALGQGALVHIDGVQVEAE